MTQSEIIKKAFRATLPVMAGYLVLGMGFGIILKSKGIDIVWSLLMSLFIYAGSMQFVAINLMTGGASFLTTAVTTLMVNARHLFYGISMVDQYKGAGAKKPYLIFSLTDETYSLVVGVNKSINPAERHRYFFLVSVMDQFYWVLGSVLGAILGSVLKINFEGMDFALTALFVTIFVDQWLTNKNHFSAISGTIISVACLLIFGPDNFLIPAMILIAAVLLAFRKREEARYE